MHALHKIMAKAAGKKNVDPGEIVDAAVDLVEINDLYPQVIESFHEMGGETVWAKDKITFVMDHYIPAPTIESAHNQKIMRDFAKHHGIEHVFDVNTGVCHQVLVEAGLVRPGIIMAVTDSHATTHGAFGAFSVGVGATDLACVLISGKLWFKVPDVMKFRLEGKLAPGVMAKDVILHILGKIRADGAIYRAIEFTGPVVESMNMSERMVLCNMAVEMGAKTSYIKPDMTTWEFLKNLGINEYPVDDTDPDFKYVEEHEFNCSGLCPHVAVPHSVDNVKPVAGVEGRSVDQVFVGSCTGGRLEDIEVVVKVLRGRKISSSLRMIVIPASTAVLKQAIKKGYISSLLESGAVVTAPGCGPCLGTHQGVLAPGEVCVSTSNRNFPGRMGSTGAEIYLVSPATAAATALTGRLCDPSPFFA